MLVVELNAGQMLEDVRLAAAPGTHIEFLGRMGGVVPLPEEIRERIEALAKTPVPYAELGDERDETLELLECYA